MMNQSNSRRQTLPMFRSELVAAILYVSVFWITLEPYVGLKAAYVPDAFGSPTWVALSGEPSQPDFLPLLGDVDLNGIPDWQDQFNDMAAQGMFTFWPGKSSVVSGIDTIFNAQWLASLNDVDGDLLPDEIDPYPQDSSNGSFYWHGGTFEMNGIVHLFRSGWYAGVVDDNNSNGMPDSVEDWFTNPSAHGTLQHWGGGTLIINGEPNTYGPVDYYAPAFSDADADGLPDELDAYPTDYWNGSNYEWLGGEFYIDGQLVQFTQDVYPGHFADSDADGIPDGIDPWGMDASNNTSWWAGGQFQVDGVAQTFAGQFHRADATDSDADGIPDDIDPLPYDIWNNHTFYWEGGTFIINNQEQVFTAGSYVGLGLDSDGDGIPDSLDPYPDQSNNANVSDQFYWAGEYFVIDNQEQFIGGTTYQGSWFDADGDGIPDQADPYPNDYENNSSSPEQYYWAGGTYLIDNITSVFQGAYYPGTWSDQDSDGIPDGLDPYSSDSANGNSTYYWAGGTFRINNVDQTFSGEIFSGTWSDQDEDGIPDVVDPYSVDNANGNSPTVTFDWVGGTFRVNNADQWFSSGTFDGSWSDQDMDGIPDIADQYPTDTRNGNDTFEWGGGTFRVNDSDQFFAPGTYQGTWIDSDGDGMPDLLDSYPSDSGNGNSQFYWNGGEYRIANSGTFFAAGFYSGSWSDQDGDGIPDIVDPFQNDSSNGCTEFWWQGGQFTINSISTSYTPGYYFGLWSDVDGDGIPDSVDPYINDANNGNGFYPPITFYWSGGTYFVDGQEVVWQAGEYEGVWSDIDSDGLPDSLDYRVNDPANNSELWAGGMFSIGGIAVSMESRWHRADSGDSDSDGIPDDLDPYPSDSLNNDGFTWPSDSPVSYTINNQSQQFSPIHYGGVWMDSDNDSIPDVADPLPADRFNGNDSDGDTLPDSVEFEYPGVFSMMDPADADLVRSDGVTYKQAYQWHPLIPLTQVLTLTLDSDADVIPDVFEIVNGLNPRDDADALASKVGDYVTNVEKYQHEINIDTIVSPSQIEDLFGQPFSEFINRRLSHLSNAENDWDGDGVSNVDELLVFSTQPRNLSSCPSSEQIKSAFATCGISETTLLNYRHILYSPPQTSSSGGSPSGSLQNVLTAPLAGSPLDLTTYSGPSSHLLSGHPVSLEPPALSSISNDVVAGVGGAFEVSPDGSANFSIPIVLPKGTGGMEPQIALAYDSDGPDGVMGTGWSVAGLGVISRGGATHPKDGVSTGVNFNNDDRFFFNGERLVFVRNGSESSRTAEQVKTGGLINGDEFRTELNQFSRIIYGVVGSIDYWTVETKGGIKFTFGGSLDSRVTPGVAGQQKALTWAVNRAEDLVGNYFTVKYQRDTAPELNNALYLDFVPSEIQYTGNERVGISPFIQLKFNYGARTQSTSAYIKRGVVRASKRLESIAIRTSQDSGGIASFPSNPDRYYQLSYETSPTTGRPRLSMVQEYFATGSGFTPSLPTTIEWESGNPGWSQQDTNGWQIPPLSDPTFGDNGFRLIDMNADGIDDIVSQHYPGRKYVKSAKPSLGIRPSDGPHFISSMNAPTSFAYRGTSQGFINLSPDKSWIPPVNISGYYSNVATELVDLNGDGLVDIVSGGVS